MATKMCKKILLLVIGATLFCDLAFAVPTFTEGYRNAKWGMSFEEVKSTFQNYKFNKDDEGDIYVEYEILGIDVRIYFCFFEDKLKEVRILYNVHNPLFGTSQDVKRGISHFGDFFDALKDKYGEPEKLSKKTPEYFSAAEAIELGEASFYGKWKTKESEIVLFLGKGKSMFSSVTLAVMYTSIYYDKIEKQKNAKSKL